MGRRLDWLPARPSESEPDLEVPFVQETPDVVRVLILQLARGAWSTLARLLQLACLTLDYKPLLAHDMANAGATGVVLDILCQAPRHHPAWRALSTAGAGLLAALVRCEGATEAAQPQALRMLLVMLESDLSCGPARQAVATALHCVVAQRTVHRDKLLAVGALPVLLRVLRRLDVLCDLVAVQELLWTLVVLTDEGGLSPAGGGGALTGAKQLQPLVAELLVPLLFLYGMPWHAKHDHMAALAARALHVHVAGYDAGKDMLRAAGMLSVLVDAVRRHSAPYVAAAKAAQSAPRRGAGVVTAAAATGSSAGRLPATRGSFALGPDRPPPHTACDVHADGEALLNSTAEHGPYACSTSAALGPWTPWQRLLAVLLIVGIVPGLFPQRRRRTQLVSGLAASGAVATAAAAGVSSCLAGPSTREELDEHADGALSSPSSLHSSSSTSGAAEAGVGIDLGAQGRGYVPRQSAGSGESSSAGQVGGENEDEEEEDDVFGSNVADRGAGPPNLLSRTSGLASGEEPGDAGSAAAAAAVADGARVICYGLLLPLLLDAGEESAGGAGATAAAVGGALLRRRLCPLRESLATLKTLLCDCEANQLVTAELGLPELLMQLAAHGDMGLAWQAVETAVFLSGGAAGVALVAAGAAEEMAHLLEESADLLHSLTLRKQIQVQNSTLTAHQHHHQHHHQHAPGTAAGARPQQISSQGARTGSLGTAAVAAPPALTGVHVRPNRCSIAGGGGGHGHGGGGGGGGGRTQRLYLVGRVPIDFTTSSSCFYGSHDAMSYCDYCTPSAAIKLLLRLMAAAGAEPAAGPAAAAAQENAVSRRFAAAGGMYGVLLLLHHEAAGVHHSKLAASLLTLLDLLLMHAPGAQDELRLYGGVGVLSTLLGSLMRPGVMDVYQLRVATCRTLQLALEGNAANKLAAREHGLLPLMVALLAALTQQRRAGSGDVVVDDNGPLTTAVLRALEVAARDSPGAQEDLLALGLLHPVIDMVRDERLDVEVRTAAVRTLTAVIDMHHAGQAGALALGIVPSIVLWLEHCVTAAATAGALCGVGGGGSSSGTAPSFAELAAPAAALVALFGALLRGGNPHAKSALVSAGALSLLLHLFRSPALSAAPAAAGEAGGGGLKGVAADVLAVLVDGDTDLQNEFVAQGGLTAAADVVRDGSAAAPQALALLSAALRSNTFVKNSARQAGVPATLVAAVRRCGLVHSAGAAAAASALAELAASNHANQEAVAVQGGLEVAVDLLREAFAALPLKILSAGGAAAAANAAAANAAAASAAAVTGKGPAASPRNGGEGRVRDGRNGAAASGAPYTVTEAAEDAAAAASLSRLLRALLGLVSACVELNSSNKAYVRELGGVSLLGNVLLTTAEALTAPPTASWLPHHHPGNADRRNGRQQNHHQQQQQQQQQQGDQGPPPLLAEAAASAAAQGGTETVAAAARMRDAVMASRAALSPAVAAACGALVAVTRESSANLARLEEMSGLALALFKLLVAADAATSLAAAVAIEWLVVRSRAQLGAASRDIFELNLVDVLAIVLYVPYAPPPVPLTLPSPPITEEGPRNAAGQAQQQGQGPVPWFMTVRALMPADGLVSAAVRDAAVVLTAIVDTADAFDAQLQMRRQTPPPQQQQQQQQQQAGAKVAAVGKQPPQSSTLTATHGSLPPLQAAHLDPVAANHSTGLMVNNLLAGPAATADAASGAAGVAVPGSQVWWAELAGSAAAAFQRVANGALKGSPAVPEGTTAAVAATLGAVSGTMGPSSRPPSPPVGMIGATSTAAQVRRRQVAWMLFLLAVKSPENRARLRWLVRASLTPLAQQLANAELCRAQLEAAAAAALQPESAPAPGPTAGSGSGLRAGGAAGRMVRTSSAALESASSVQGRLPISTAALEELGDGLRRAPSPSGGPTTTRAASEHPPSPPPPPAPAGSAGSAQQYLHQPQAQAPVQIQQPLPMRPQQPYPQHQTGPQQPLGGLPSCAPLPPHWLSARPVSSSSSSSQVVQGPMPQPQGHTRAASTGAIGAGLLYGKMYGTSAAPPAATDAAGSVTASSSVPGTPRDPHLVAAAADSPAVAALRAHRLSRTASGHTPSRSTGGGGTISASGTPRGSLSGAIAAAFAPSPAHAAAGGGPAVARGSQAPSPRRSRMGSASCVPAPAAEAAPMTPGCGSGGGGCGGGGGGGTAVAPSPATVPRALHAQVSGGGSSVMSDDDELAMIQQEVALLANLTVTGAAAAAAAAAGGAGAGRGGGPLSSAAPGGRGGTTPGTSSPVRWPSGRR